MDVCVVLTGCMSLLIVFFFFKAEDGIRVVAVTGVQTCALPISRLIRRAEGISTHADPAGSVLVAGGGGRVFRGEGRLSERSEERRVGKECRSRWSPYH